MMSFTYNNKWILYRFSSTSLPKLMAETRYFPHIIQFLRLIQYATLNSKANKGLFAAVYDQIRMTRKVLRFLRTLEYSTKVRQEVPELKKHLSNPKALIFRLFSILEKVFTFLFFLSDHRVFLSEIKVIDKSNGELHYPRSMKFYFLQNLFGVLKNLLEMTMILFEQRTNEKELKSV